MKSFHMFKVFLFPALSIFTCYSITCNNIFALLDNYGLNNTDASERIFVGKRGFSKHSKFSPE